MLLLENVHLATAEFAGILAQLELDAAEQEPMVVLATARTKVRVAPSMQPRLDAAVIDLAAAARQRGDALLTWWLRDVLRLDDATRHRAYRSVPWDRYRHDLVVLALALEAFDPAAVAVTTERIEAALEDRLRRTIEAHADADELLYLIAALGKYALAADLRALGAMLGRTPEAIRQIVEHAAANGLLSIDREVRTCRFWHDSLAQAYWDVFEMRRVDWAARLRARYRSMP